MTSEADHILIRRATAEDAAKLASFAARCFELAFGSETKPSDMKRYLAGAFSPAIQAQEIAETGGTVLLAFEEEAAADHLAAYAYFSAGEETIKLHRLYVDVSWHGRGLAARLMRQIIDDSRGRGAKRIQLTVWTKNHKAIAFYKKVGFRICGSETFMVGEDAQTDHAMELVVLS
jgi:diamine N-acetyltransferase